MWANRFHWSGETPTNFPGLNPVALNRVHADPDNSGDYLDAIEPSRAWQYRADGAAAWWGSTSGPLGRAMQMNEQSPANEQGRVTLDHFDGLWPAEGRLLVGLWARQLFSMSFNPLVDTRATDPFIYLSTAGGTGDPRVQLYGAGGSLLLDKYESDLPWKQTSEYYYLGVLVDLDAGTSQLFSVHRGLRQAWLAPVRSYDGAANAGAAADVDVFSLRHASYWEAGRFDDVLIAHPSSSFDLQAFVDAMRGGTWADGQDGDQYDLFDVTDSGITAVEAGEFSTGAELAEWDRQPVVVGDTTGATAYLSEDDGDTWQQVDPAEWPDTFTGLVRWQVQLGPGDTFTGLEVEEPDTPEPTLQPVPSVTLQQGELQQVELDYTVEGPASWTVEADPLLEVTRTEGTLHLAAGFDVGPADVTVTLTDELGRSVAQTFTAVVEPRSWDSGEPPAYPHTPVILWDGDGPAAVLIDAMEARLTKEVNGADTFALTIPANHKHAGLIQNERVLQVAGEKYWTRRVTTERSGRRIVLEVYAEARFYELATAGEVEAAEWDQVSAGRVMEYALQGTGWSVDTANVTTRRSYDTEDGNPLELLRTVQEQHGGDLVFNNEARTVSLVTQSGRDNGLAFFHGRGLTDSRRVVDTTSLVTRLYARNEDGLTIADVNNGRPYVEDYGYSSELRTATYKFKAGTSPHTMLSMAQATLANRSRPDYSYEVTVNDLSAYTGEAIDRFDVGDLVTVVDPAIGLEESQRIVTLEYDVLRPWASELTLSARLRETSDGDSGDAGTMETGTTAEAFDLVPYNLLRNARFDNGLAHWAHSGVEVVDGQGTGDYAVRFEGPGERWIEQTVQPDNRSAYAFSFDVDTSGPAGWEPDLTVEAVVTYEDGSSETIELDLS